MRFASGEFTRLTWLAEKWQSSVMTWPPRRRSSEFGLQGRSLRHLAPGRRSSRLTASLACSSYGTEVTACVDSTPAITLPFDYGGGHTSGRLVKSPHAPSENKMWGDVPICLHC